MIIMALGTFTLSSSLCLDALVWGLIAWSLGGIERPLHRLVILGLLITATLLSQWITASDSLGRLAGSVLSCRSLPRAWIAPMTHARLLRGCLGPLMLGTLGTLWLSAEHPAPAIPCELTLSEHTGTTAPIARTPGLLLLWRDDCRACRWALSHAHSLKRAQPQAPIEAINQGQTLLQVVRARHSPLTLRLDTHQQLGTLLGITALPALVVVKAPGQCSVAFQGHDVLSSAAGKKISRVLDEASPANR